MKIIISIIHALRDLLIRKLPRLKRRSGFAFLVHPRNINDVYRKYPFAKYFPNKIVEFFLKLFWPVILSEITGLFSQKNGKPVRGWLITIPLTAEQMLKDRKLAEKRIIQAAKLAEKIGVKLMGLGALTSSVTRGGLDLIGNVELFITAGSSLTAAIALEDIDTILRDKRLDIQQASIAIIGATGSIGQAVVKCLASKHFKNLILIGRTPDHLKALEDKIKIQNPTVNLTISTEITKIRSADIVIVATASAEVLIKSEYLKQKAVIYDVSQPQNVSPDIFDKRPDISVIDGGLVATPNINYHFNFGCPKETAFACLAETILLAAEEKYENYSIGKVDLQKAQEISNIAKKYNFKSCLKNAIIE